jgi:K+-transporting ATPase KdpF subunit
MAHHTCLACCSCIGIRIFFKTKSIYQMMTALFFISIAVFCYLLYVLLKPEKF